MLQAKGYEILLLDYSTLPDDKLQAFAKAKGAAASALKQLSWNRYSQILFVYKSIGTCVAGVFCREITHNRNTDVSLFSAKETMSNVQIYNIFFTPTNETLPCH